MKEARRQKSNCESTVKTSSPMSTQKKSLASAHVSTMKESAVKSQAEIEMKIFIEQPRQSEKESLTGVSTWVLERIKKST